MTINTQRLRITRQCIAGGEHRDVGYEGEFAAIDAKNLLAARRAIRVERNPEQRRALAATEIMAALNRLDPKLKSQATAAAVETFLVKVLRESEPVR